MKPRTVVDLGVWLRDLRQKRGQTLREVAAAAGMDPALLSKIENGSRLPTTAQATGLARYFAVSEDDMQARRIAGEFLGRYGDDPSAERALGVIREGIRQTISVSVKAAGGRR